MKTPITFYLETDLKEKVKKVATEEGMTVSAFLRYLLRKEIKKATKEGVFK